MVYKLPLYLMIQLPLETLIVHVLLAVLCDDDNSVLRRVVVISPDGGAPFVFVVAIGGKSPQESDCASAWLACCVPH